MNDLTSTNISMTSREVSDALLIAKVCKVAYENGSASGFEYAKRIAIPTNQDILHLYNAMLGYIGEIRKQETSENELQKKFFDNLSSYIPGAVRVFKKGTEDDKPDGFIEINNKILPVEVKKESFDYRALIQLSRYIKRFECSQGIAVAKNLICKLPEHVIFIQMK